MSNYEDAFDNAMEYLQKGKYNEAIRAFTRALGFAPNSGGAYVGRGDAYLALGNLEHAKSDYQKAIQIYPRDEWRQKLNSIQGGISSKTPLEQHIEFGQRLRGDLENANRKIIKLKRQKSALEQKLNDEIESHNFTRQIDQGKRYQSEGNFDLAIKGFTYIIGQIESIPEYVAAYENRAIAFQSTNQQSLAESDLKQVERLKSPKTAEEFCARGNKYFEQEKFDLALTDFRQAVELNPKLAIAYEGRAKVYEKVGEFGLAMKDFKKALELK